MRHKLNNSKISSRICPICNSEEKKIIYKQNFGENRKISLLKQYNVVICENCGFIFADRIPRQEKFDAYYKKISKYEFSHKEGFIPKSYIRHFKKIVNFLLPHIKNKNIKILDIGCSTGGLLSVFKFFGYYNLLGIDPSPFCKKIAKDLYDIKIITDSISTFSTYKKFDLIILSAVLEHLVDLNSVMTKIKFLLKKEGLLFIEIPDIERFDSYAIVPFQQFSTEHINYFSRYSIKNLLSKFTFEIIKIQRNQNKVTELIDPDLFVLAKKTDKKNNNKIIKDCISETKINSYVNRCINLDLKIKKNIKKKLSDKNKIIVWGVGTITQRFIGQNFLSPSKILYFVDSNKRYIGKKLNNIEIKSPSDIKEKVPILISTYSYQKEITYQIKRILRLKNEIIKIF